MNLKHKTSISSSLAAVLMTIVSLNAVADRNNDFRMPFEAKYTGTLPRFTQVPQEIKEKVVGYKIESSLCHFDFTDDLDTDAVCINTVELKYSDKIDAEQIKGFKMVELLTKGTKYNAVSRSAANLALGIPSVAAGVFGGGKARDRAIEDAHDIIRMLILKNSKNEKSANVSDQITSQVPSQVENANGDEADVPLYEQVDENVHD